MCKTFDALPVIVIVQNVCIRFVILFIQYLYVVANMLLLHSICFTITKPIHRIHS